MNDDQYFYHISNILNILFLLLYLIFMLIERMYIKKNLSRVCKLAFDNEKYFNKIDLGNYLVLSFLPIVIQIGFLREKIILKRKVVFPEPPILFSSITDKKMELFFKKYKSWLYISNIKWIFGLLWFLMIGIIKLYSK
ncbi:hypothetical protein [Acinetobacter baumannii]|uniref:hypothetical protein n=1 Tax=Acinetobacter baumannii TaxID=470 RepID=UPI00101FA435|nr:hypothetical protein [Acinetobacter baumannii]RYL13361.1 hypothetical protein EWO92_19915 [Acinetobacter baumannii]RYL41294.1 hypothetical protein EWP49_20075 [Acinetobacter baumannii]